MPQMMPINWLLSFLLFLFIYLIFNIMNYYIYNLNNNNKYNINNNKNFNLMKKNKNLNWKW
uniref:ATP synthase complex subunit 8 n=4 Tax=Lymantria dispar TaxID=13123 RepID=A0A0C5C2U2_LYMDI|nr:ATP synthase F0 subunit 8 [Lymantria dispar]AJM89383.1 ATP synthase F0 subunit 8 [Lymantria dispar asiatica]AJM89415.1 ATP synthase F0 subunit 8 [Lymantria dispar japonica]AJM89447.1 ATP synthase F0 subunit 8 [Lymantria dispar dispar]ACL93260.1 ATP synthase F0 subunit 8 [Lymantria dispar]AJM89385.1 ATP synthase F0 subunit 8 [Lymantria dispar asiatica]